MKTATKYGAGPRAKRKLRKKTYNAAEKFAIITIIKVTDTRVFAGAASAGTGGCPSGAGCAPVTGLTRGR